LLAPCTSSCGRLSYSEGTVKGNALTMDSSMVLTYDSASRCLMGTCTHVHTHTHTHSRYTMCVMACCDSGWL
jgi:hypothetical protein